VVFGNFFFSPILKSPTHIGFIGVKKNGSKISHLGTFNTIFHNKGKSTELNGSELLYDDNEPNADDPHLIIPLERYHNNHPNPDCRAYY
jgi:hypothetical protein